MLMFGPTRLDDETVSAFRWRMASYSLRWTPGAGLAFVGTIYLLRQGLGQGPLWMAMVFVAMLAGFALAIAGIAAIGFLIGAIWAGLCESHQRIDKAWKRTSFMMSFLLLVATWAGAAYSVVSRIVMHHEIRIFSRFGSHVFRYEEEPGAFIINAALWVCVLIVLPGALIKVLRRRLGSRN